MKVFLLLSFSLFFFIQPKHHRFLQASDKEYVKYPAISMKAFIPNKNIFMVDTRDKSLSSEGYVKNSILLPLTMDYETWFPDLIKENSNVVLICDRDNYKEALKKTESLGSYNILGYALYKDIIKDESIEIQVAEYQKNTKKQIKKLIENEKYLLDVREVSECKETGVIEQAKIILDYSKEEKTP